MIVVIVVMVAVVVAPGPIVFLLFWWQFAKIAAGVTMGLVCPAVIIDGLVIAPHMIVGVVRVVDANIMMFAGDSG
jgi:hypothetical protein